jgi:hypothetical protein
VPAAGLVGGVTGPVPEPEVVGDPVPEPEVVADPVPVPEAGGVVAGLLPVLVDADGEGETVLRIVRVGPGTGTRSVFVAVQCPELQDNATARTTTNDANWAAARAPSRLPLELIAMTGH